MKEPTDRTIATQGNRHILTLADTECSGGLYVYVQPCSSGLLKKYDKKSGETEFREDLYPTASLMAQIILFRGDACLTGEGKSFEEIAVEQRKSKAGVNRILIRLDKKETTILDCLIDGVVYWKDGKQVVSTA